MTQVTCPLLEKEHAAPEVGPSLGVDQDRRRMRLRLTQRVTQPLSWRGKRLAEGTPCKGLDAAIQPRREPTFPV